MTPYVPTPCPCVVCVTQKAYTAHSVAQATTLERAQLQRQLERVSMPFDTMRKIQEHNDDVFYERQDGKGPLPGLRAGRGADESKERNVPGRAYVSLRDTTSSMRRKRTSLNVIFDMVAELAIAER
eukprot:1815844-Amphidinium_carterae.1